MSARDALPGTTLPEVNAAHTRRVTAYSVMAATLLIGIKAFAWQASGSVAVLSSLADSALDLAASLITFWAVRYAAAPPDAEHRHGHGKAEAFASLIQSGLVFASAALVGWEAVRRLQDPVEIVHGGWAVGVMAASIVVTLALVVAQTRALKATGSVAVAGDRAHYLADLTSNLAALLGVAGAAWLGFPVLDAVAGLFVAAWLVWGAIQVFRGAADHLLDRELPAEQTARIVELVRADPRVLGLHQLRTRVAGPYVLIQMHADLDPELTLKEAHDIMVAAEERILEHFPAADIIIHPDPRGVTRPHGGAFGEPDSPSASPEPAG